MKQSERIETLKRKTIDVDPRRSWIPPDGTYHSKIQKIFQPIYDSVVANSASGGSSLGVYLEIRNEGKNVISCSVYDFPGNCGTCLFMQIGSGLVPENYDPAITKVTEDDITEINCIIDTIQSTLSRVNALYCCPINMGYERREEFLKKFNFEKMKESGFLNINSSRTNFTFVRVIKSKKV